MAQPHQSPKLWTPGAFCVGCVHCPVIVEPWLLLASLGGTDPQADELWGLAVSTTEKLPTSWSRTCFRGLWCSLSSPHECVACGGDRVVILHGVKLSTGCTSSGAFVKVHGQPLPVPCIGPLRMNYSDLQMAATCAALGGDQERPSLNQGQLLQLLGLGPLRER